MIQIKTSLNYLLLSFFTCFDVQSMVRGAQFRPHARRTAVLLTGATESPKYPVAAPR